MALQPPQVSVPPAFWRFVTRRYMPVPYPA